MSEMSNSPNYTDDIPVKIAEKYRPPVIYMPTEVIECLQNRKDDDEFASYDFSLERIILAKTLEWRNLKFREKEERLERIRVKEAERAKRIEEEQKTKLNQVSYPSTDDLNSSEDEEEGGETTEATKNLSPDAPQVINASQNIQKFDEILVPTKSESSNFVRPTHKRGLSGNKIDFSYFETVNSNPFDNMELKTMNEMDILAEVLRDSRDPTEGNLERNNSSESDSDKTSNGNSQKIEQTQEVQEAQQTNSATGSSNQQLVYAPQNQNQNYANYYNYSNYQGNSYYVGTGTYQQQPQQHQQQHNYQYYHNSNSNQSYAPTYNNYSNYMNYDHKTINNNTIINESSAKDAYHYGNPYSTQPSSFVQNNTDQAPTKSKSKSVPDLVKEINDELNNCERRRIRNNSQTLHSQKNEEDIPVKPDELASSKRSDVEKEFRKMSIASQNLVKNISLMGFPLDLVSRCVQKLGSDEKQHIIEHLIVLSELLDLGFEETRISEALIKFDNNKDKALDFLIS